MDKIKVKNSEDIAHISLYLPIPVIFHGYVIPFVFLYSFVFYIWLTFWGFNEYFEVGLILLAVVGCIQILTCLFCHWFVFIKCLLTCRKVYINLLLYLIIFFRKIQLTRQLLLKLYLLPIMEVLIW